MAEQMFIRFAEATDRYALEALQRKASLANEHDRAALLANPAVISLSLEQIAAHQVLVAARQGLIVGFAVLMPKRDGDLELDGLFVDPALWNKGIGKALVKRCASLAREMDAHALHVIGNPHAQRFYEACGFTKYGRITTEFGSSALLMKLAI